MTHPVRCPRKLIEVALPLDAINTEASLRKRKAPAGYPTALHKWWAQRPLAAARAVIFAQLVNDPGFQQGGGFRYGKNKKEAALERQRLFRIIEDLVLWENTSNEEVLECARAEIRRSWQEVCDLNKGHPRAAELFDPEHPPAFHDPFAGSGAIPLEAQRLGLNVFASDLNPVAVLINKAMIEIPLQFTELAPVGPPQQEEEGARLDLPTTWPRATGLAEDVRRYGAWMKAEAEKRLGHLYPEVEVTDSMARERPDLQPLIRKRLQVVAWLWARTVKSPNPAFSHVAVPLASSFILSSKAGREFYVQPIVKGDHYKFVVKMGTPLAAARGGTTAGKRAGFLCLVSGTPIDYPYIRNEGTRGRLGQRMMAVVAEGPRGRVYLPPSPRMEDVAAAMEAEWKPETETHGKCRVNIGLYGLTKWSDLFTQRQLVALDVFSDLLKKAQQKIRKDAISHGRADGEEGLALGGQGATAYAEAVSVYLAFGLSRLADYGCANATWRPKDSAMRSGIPMQALPMTWDFAEGNPFGPSSAGFQECTDVVARVIETSLAPLHSKAGVAEQLAAQRLPDVQRLGCVISTDPPYYDNIGYADLSDFFYVWLRHNLKALYPSLFATVAVPKTEELVATPFRHTTQEAADTFFLEGMTQAMSNLALASHVAFPITIYYAFKQSETHEAGTVSPGWESFLAAVILAGFTITGTWPVRTEGDNRQVGVGSNALASSIVLVCRKRSVEAPSISRREFLRELDAVLPEALDEMTGGAGSEHSPVAPVDLSQAIIGPGMAVFSKYASVLEADGTAMGVRTALQLINRYLAEDDFDADTQFCLHWFEQHGWNASAFGEADVLARSKATSVDGLRDAGVLSSGGGRVRLLKWGEYPISWDPRADARTPVWEALHQLIRALQQGGESASGALLAALGGKAESVRQLAYRLYTLCERLGHAEDARGYNELITSWTGIESAASRTSLHVDAQGTLFER